MKKLIRFKYEKCRGTCYTGPDDKFPELDILPKEELTILIKKVVSAHNSTCDDPNQWFGVDMCEKTNLYVGHFYDGKQMEMFTSTSLVDILNDLSDYILQVNENKKFTYGLCKYGFNTFQENLEAKIMSMVG
jgi:hypothetical protein